MILFGTLCLIFGTAVIFNSAILSFVVGLVFLIIGSWVILGWYRVNRVLEKKFTAGKYTITFHKKDTPGR